jgi:hypothetical protein
MKGNVKSAEYVDDTYESGASPGEESSEDGDGDEYKPPAKLTTAVDWEAKIATLTAEVEGIRQERVKRGLVESPISSHFDGAKGRIEDLEAKVESLQGVVKTLKALVAGQSEELANVRSEMNWMKVEWTAGFEERLAAVEARDKERQEEHEALHDIMKETWAALRALKKEPVRRSIGINADADEIFSGEKNDGGAAATPTEMVIGSPDKDVAMEDSTIPRQHRGDPPFDPPPPEPLAPPPETFERPTADPNPDLGTSGSRPSTPGDPDEGYGPETSDAETLSGPKGTLKNQNGSCTNARAAQA